MAQVWQLCCKVVLLCFYSFGMFMFDGFPCTEHSSIGALLGRASPSPAFPSITPYPLPPAVFTIPLPPSNNNTSKSCAACCASCCAPLHKLDWNLHPAGSLPGLLGMLNKACLLCLLGMLSLLGPVTVTASQGLLLPPEVLPAVTGGKRGRIYHRGIWWYYQLVMAADMVGILPPFYV